MLASLEHIDPKDLNLENLEELRFYGECIKKICAVFDEMTEFIESGKGSFPEEDYPELLEITKISKAEVQDYFAMMDSLGIKL
jgi:hypothetical protein